MEVTIYRKGGEYHTDFERRVVDGVDTVEGRELFFRGEVSQGVFDILSKGSLDNHDDQARKILKINEE